VLAAPEALNTQDFEPLRLAERATDAAFPKLEADRLVVPLPTIVIPERV
jgi:hypothetical protein